MKKYAFALAIVATLVIALVTAGFVNAQGTTPPVPQTPGSGYGYGRGTGMMGGRGMGGNGGAMGNGVVGEGILHDTMISVAAQKLGISVDDLNARLAKGETMAQVASSKGLTAEQFTALMKDARTQAIDQAVKDGKLTQTQADWMKQRGGAIGNGGMGNGGGMMGGNGGRGMRGNGAGNANCPYFSQTTP
jgi:hypothetical protein